MEVLRVYAGGIDIKSAAEKLTLSPKTVMVHLENMKKKTGAVSNRHLVFAALRGGRILLSDLPDLGLETSIE